MYQDLENHVVLCGASGPESGAQRVPECVAGGEGAAPGLQLFKAQIIQGATSLHLDCSLLCGLCLLSGLHRGDWRQRPVTFSGCSCSPLEAPRYLLLMVLPCPRGLAPSVLTDAPVMERRELAKKGSAAEGGRLGNREGQRGGQNWGLTNSHFSTIPGAEEENVIGSFIL